MDLVQQLLLHGSDRLGTATRDLGSSFSLSDGLLGFLLQEVAVRKRLCEACGYLVRDAIARGGRVLKR